MSNEFKVTIEQEISRVGYNLFFPSLEDATGARDRIMAAVYAHKRETPNDPEAQFMTVEHEYGSVTFRPKYVGTVTVWDGENARIVDFENAKDQRDAQIKTQGELLSVVIHEALVAASARATEGNG